jgi:hypothetical protein
MWDALLVQPAREAVRSPVIAFSAALLISAA